jgi:hypothetical protein
MNGAESLLRTLVGSGVEVCFGNPGTSEMHFVAALDRVEGMRVVLGLFEGAVTGMADGYGRMEEKPAATLLHLGPGLANGLANLHNARRAGRRSSISSATTRPIMRNMTLRLRRTFMVCAAGLRRGCIRRQAPGLSPRTGRWPCRPRCNIPVRSRR